MRLTLRNMLAYMDGLLGAEDAEQIGKRIKGSEQATGLLHRIRDVMRRLRLAAPSPTDRGPGLDPNTVAEYLDHTLHDDKVTDFEKVCLESDVQLAEVAACHQVLTLVLGEAAEIDPATRERMYQVPGQEAAEAEARDSADGSSEDDESPQKSPRRRPSVPDYLREPRKRRRFLPVAVVLALAVCLAVIVLGLAGQFRPGTPLGDALASLSGSDQAEPAGPAEPVDKPPEEEGPEPRILDPSEQPEPGPVEQPEPEPSVPPEPGPAEQPEPGPAEQPEPEPSVSADVEPPIPAEVQPPIPAEVQPPPAPLPGEVSQPPKGLAGLMSEEDVLLRFDSESARWRQVLPEVSIFAGERLLALPTYRPLLALMTAGITVRLVDGTQAELLPTDAANVPGLKADYGQLILRTIGKPGARLRLQVGDRSGLITFVDAESSVVLEVIPVHVPGTNPETEPGWIVADLYAQDGEVLWGEADAEQTVQIPAGSWVMLSDQPTQPAVPVEGLPEWVEGGEADWAESATERMASANLARTLSTERGLRVGVGLVLIELSEHSRREYRWFAARCLGYVGDFGPLVAVLNDPDYPPIWTDQAIEGLRTAVARSPETAAQLREALERQYEDDGAAELYRMLWGYTEEGLRNREADQLVDYLGSSLLAARTLSYWNLRDIFDLELQYRPNDREAARRGQADRWRSRLKSDEIWIKRFGTPRTPPAEIPPAETAEPPS